jgi:hypothetical protein
VGNKRRGHGEGSIFRRDDGRWCAVLNLGWENGRRARKYLYGATAAEVREMIVIAPSGMSLSAIQTRGPGSGSSHAFTRAFPNSLLLEGRESGTRSAAAVLLTVQSFVSISILPRPCGLKGVVSL